MSFSAMVHRVLPGVAVRAAGAEALVQAGGV